MVQLFLVRFLLLLLMTVSLTLPLTPDPRYPDDSVVTQSCPVLVSVKSGGEAQSSSVRRRGRREGRGRSFAGVTGFKLCLGQMRLIWDKLLSILKNFGTSAPLRCQT